MTGPAPLPPPDADDHWDAGEMGCGELMLRLRGRMKQIAAGQVLHLTARDTGAIEDIPSWCGMTGHTLLHADHPDYWVRHRPDD